MDRDQEALYMESPLHPWSNTFVTDTLEFIYTAAGRRQNSRAARWFVSSVAGLAVLFSAAMGAAFWWQAGPGGRAAQMGREGVRRVA